jgi:hypothetical protein
VVGDADKSQHEEEREDSEGELVSHAPRRAVPGTGWSFPEVLLTLVAFYMMFMLANRTFLIEIVLLTATEGPGLATYLEPRRRRPDARL